MDKYIKIKLTICGNINVGKTTLSNFLSTRDVQMIQNEYNSTIGVDYYNSIYKKNMIGQDNEKYNGIKYSLWDVSGNDRFRNIVSPYIKNIHGVIIMYDITSESYIDDIKYWIKKVRNINKDCIITILGNKKDLLNDKYDINIIEEDLDELMKKYDIFERHEISMYDINNLDNVINDVNNMIENIVIKLELLKINKVDNIITFDRLNNNDEKQKCNTLCCQYI